MKSVCLTSVLILYLICPLLLKGQIKVYKTYNDYVSQLPLNEYRDIVIKTKKIILKDNKGLKQEIPKDSIWGYTRQYSNQKIIRYRLFNNRSYIIDTLSNSITIYYLIDDEITLVYDMIISDPKKKYFFSLNPLKPIFALNADNLVKCLNLSNELQSQVNELGKKSRLTKKNPETSKYYLLELIESNLH